jgi:hypothetical protein
VSWSPTTAVLTTQSPLTPSASATTSGDGAISYSVTSAGATGCSVDSASGVLTYTAAGSCVVRATAAPTARYSQATTDVTFVVSGTRSCEDGGTCQIGDRGPGGGTVFYISNADCLCNSLVLLKFYFLL